MKLGNNAVIMVLGLIMVMGCSREKAESHPPAAGNQLRESPQPAAGQSQEREPEVETAEETQQASSAKEPQAEPGPEPLPQEQGKDGKIILRASARVKRGRDISLSRDTAAAAARRNLLNLLIEKGYLPREQNELAGSTIERFYSRGRFLYAVAAIEVEGKEGVNHSVEAASKKTEDSNGGKR